MQGWLNENALVDKVHNKKFHAHSDMHSIPWSHYIPTLYTPLIPVNLVPTGMPLLLVQEWLLNNVVMVWGAYPCMHGTSCFVQFVSQCIH